MTIRPELLDELLAQYSKAEDLFGEEGLFKKLKKALLERALGGEVARSAAAAATMTTYGARRRARCHALFADSPMR